jgi:hypothetical protein
MERLSSIVLIKALLEIHRHTYVALAMFGKTFNEVDVVHRKQPSAAKALEGILLRAEANANPAKRR